MPTNNAARRLHWLMTEAHKVQDPHGMTKPAADFWPVILHIEDPDRAARDEEILRLLTLSRGQVDAVERYYRARGTEAGKYVPYLTAIRSAIEPRALTVQWQPSVLSMFNGQAMVFMDMTAEHMDDEPALSEEQLAAMRSLVDDFRDSIAAAEAELSPAALQFLRRQLAYLYGALRAYAITGAQAFRDASDIAATDWISNSVVLRPYGETPVVGKWRGLWLRLKELQGDVEVVGKCMDYVVSVGRLATCYFAATGQLSPAEAIAINGFLELYDGPAGGVRKLLSAPDSGGAKPPLGTPDPDTGESDGASTLHI